MEIETLEKHDLVHVVQGNRRICTVIEVGTKEPKYKVQFGTDAGSVERFRSFELALVQKYTAPECSSVLSASL